MLKYLLLAVGLLLASFVASSDAAAACTGTAVHGGAGHSCFAILGGGFSTNGVWSATSGGGSCACVPTTGDDLIFDANTPSGTYATAGALSLNSFDASAAHAGVIISGNSNMTVTGTFFQLSSALSYTHNGSWTFTSTAGTTTIKTGGQSLTTLTLNGAGGTFSFGGDTQNNLIVSATFTLTAGTLDASTNNPPVTAGEFLSTNANTRVVNCGSSTWTINGTGAVGQLGSWDFSTATGLTTSCASTAIVFAPTGALAGLRYFNPGGKSFGNVTINGGNGAFPFTMAPPASGTVFNSLSFAGTSPFTVGMSNATTTTLTVAPTWANASSAMVLLIGSPINGGTAPILAIPGNATVSGMAFEAFTFSGGNVTANKSFSFGQATCSSCTLTVNPPPSGGGGIIGG